MRIIAPLTVFFAFGITGLFVGYLMGFSASPTVSASIPVIVSIIGSLSYANLSRHLLQSEFQKVLEKAEITGPTREYLITQVFRHRSYAQGPACYSLLAIVFVICCWIGTEWGVSRRSNLYESPIVLIESANAREIDGVEKELIWGSLPYKKRVAVLRIHYTAKSRGISPRDHKLLLQVVGERLAADDPALDLDELGNIFVTEMQSDLPSAEFNSLLGGR